MSKFDDFVGDIMFRARNVADVAGKKTGEVVELGKLKYQIKQLEWEIEKTYVKLGAIVYESQKSSENFDEVIALAISEIDALKDRVIELEEKIRAQRNVICCPACKKENDNTASFCIRCGASLAGEPEAPIEIKPEDIIDGDAQ